MNAKQREGKRVESKVTSTESFQAGGKTLVIEKGIEGRKILWSDDEFPVAYAKLWFAGEETGEVENLVVEDGTRSVKQEMIITETRNHETLSTGTEEMLKELPRVIATLEAAGMKAHIGHELQLEYKPGGFASHDYSVTLRRVDNRHERFGGWRLHVYSYRGSKKAYRSLLKANQLAAEIKEDRLHDAEREWQAKAVADRQMRHRKLIESILPGAFRCDGKVTVKAAKREFGIYYNADDKVTRVEETRHYYADNERPSLEEVLRRVAAEPEVAKELEEHGDVDWRRR